MGLPSRFGNLYTLGGRESKLSVLSAAITLCSLYKTVGHRVIQLQLYTGSNCLQEGMQREISEGMVDG